MSNQLSAFVGKRCRSGVEARVRRVDRRAYLEIAIPAVNPKQRAWNMGRVTGQQRSLLPKQVLASHALLELAGNLHNMTPFNGVIESRPRGCGRAGVGRIRHAFVPSDQSGRDLLKGRKP